MDQLVRSAIVTLAEVGLDKLRRDYAFYLGTVGTFDAEMAFFNDDSVSIDLQLDRMHALHRVMELWAFFKHNIPSLAPDAMRAILDVAMQRAVAGVRQNSIFEGFLVVFGCFKRFFDTFLWFFRRLMSMSRLWCRRCCRDSPARRHQQWPH